VWRYVYRAVDQDGQVIDVLVSAKRDAATARRFFHRALTMLKATPAEVVTDAAPIYPAVLEELIPAAWHHVDRHDNNPIEADHSHLKHRLRPMRGLRTDRTAQVIIAGQAFPQNLRRGHYVRTPSMRHRRRRHRTGRLLQILLRGTPIHPTRGGDLGIRRTPLKQGTEPTYVHPGLLIQDH
jgi:transposase-like protein